MIVTLHRSGGAVVLRMLLTFWSDGQRWRGTYRESLPCGGYLIHRVDLSWCAMSAERI